MPGMSCRYIFHSGWTGNRFNVPAVSAGIVLSLYICRADSMQFKLSLPSRVRQPVILPKRILLFLPIIQDCVQCRQLLPIRIRVRHPLSRRVILSRYTHHFRVPCRNVLPCAIHCINPLCFGSVLPCQLIVQQPLSIGVIMQ